MSTKKVGKKAAAPRKVYDREECCARIFAAMAEGRGLKTICREEDGLPSVGTFLGWMDEDKSFADRYARARALCLDAMAEEMVHISDTPEIGTKSVSKATGLEITEGDMVEHRRLRVETRKWLLAKLAPKKYGERQAIEHSGTMTLESLVTGAKK